MDMVRKNLGFFYMLCQIVQKILNVRSYYIIRVTCVHHCIYLIKTSICTPKLSKKVCLKTFMPIGGDIYKYTKFSY